MKHSTALTGVQISSHGKHVRHGHRGQALVELALVAPVLLALVVGSIEFGRFAYLSILVGNAARAGAAYGSVGLAQAVDTTGIQSAADNDFQNNGRSISTLTVTSNTSCGCDNGGTVIPAGCSTNSNATAGTCTSGNWVVMVSVTASATFHSLFNYRWIPKSITVSRTVTLRVNQLGA